MMGCAAHRYSLVFESSNGSALPVLALCMLFTTVRKRKNAKKKIIVSTTCKDNSSVELLSSAKKSKAERKLALNMIMANTPDNALRIRSDNSITPFASCLAFHLG